MFLTRLRCVACRDVAAAGWDASKWAAQKSILTLDFFRPLESILTLAFFRPPKSILTLDFKSILTLAF